MSRAGFAETARLHRLGALIRQGVPASDEFASRLSGEATVAWPSGVTNKTHRRLFVRKAP
jgi:hypothetical protein